MASLKTKKAFGLRYTHHTIHGLTLLLRSSRQTIPADASKTTLFNALSNYEKSIPPHVRDILAAALRRKYNVSASFSVDTDGLVGAFAGIGVGVGGNSAHVSSLEEQGDDVGEPGAEASAAINALAIVESEEYEIEEYECVLCLQDFPSAEFPDKYSDTCGHRQNICTECITFWLKDQVEQTGGALIQCPACPETLAFEDVARLADDATFIRYEELSTRRLLMQQEHYHECPSCDHGQLFDPSDNPTRARQRMRCESCKRATCLVHRIRWHKGMTCEQYDASIAETQMAKDEKATKAFFASRRHIAPCPGCGILAEKIDGCTHVRCRSCRTDFYLPHAPDHDKAPYRGRALNPDGERPFDFGAWMF